MEDLTRGAFGHCQSLPSDEGARGKKKRELTPSSCQGTRRRAGTRWRRSSSFSDPLDVLQTVLSLNLPRDFSSIDIPDAACLSCELSEAADGRKTYVVLSAGRGTSSTFETIRINFRFFVQRMKNCRTTPQRTSPRDSHLVELFERRGKKVWCLRRDEFVQCCGEPRPGTAKIDASTKIVESWASKTPEQKAARIFQGAPLGRARAWTLPTIPT